MSLLKVIRAIALFLSICTGLSIATTSTNGQGLSTAELNRFVDFCLLNRDVCDPILEISESTIRGVPATVVKMRDICANGSIGAERGVCGDKQTISLACLLDPRLCGELPRMCQLAPCAPGCPGYASGDCPPPYVLVTDGFDGDGVTDPWETWRRYAGGSEVPWPRMTILQDMAVR
jgi:hypothetical protein